MRQLGADGPVGDCEERLHNDDAVGRDRVGEALDSDFTARLAMDLVLHMGEGLVRDEYPAGRRLVLEPVMNASAEPASRWRSRSVSEVKKTPREAGARLGDTMDLDGPRPSEPRAQIATTGWQWCSTARAPGPFA
jgi:hypothetical protein